MLQNIETFIDKTTEGFKKRIVINWDDGARTSLINNQFTLLGKDGKIYNVFPNSEHDLICRRIILENGYSLP